MEEERPKKSHLLAEAEIAATAAAIVLASATAGEPHAIAGIHLAISWKRYGSSSDVQHVS